MTMTISITVRSGSLPIANIFGNVDAMAIPSTPGVTAALASRFCCVI